MLFNSYIFIFLFLPATLIGYYMLHHYNKITYAKCWLLSASLIFYGYFNAHYGAIIISSILMNYLFHYLLVKNTKTQGALIRKLLLATGIMGNLGVLFYFKYFDFFLENVNFIFHTALPLKQILLPLGISFFTFQQLSFVIDSYQRKTPYYGLLDYAVYVSFFPQLIAGPIVLHNEFMPQFLNPENKRFHYEHFANGIRYFCIGLAKKVLLADTFGRAVAIGWDTYKGLNSFSALVVMLSFTLQLYFDFSGYSDMAIGLGQMFNIDLPVNFNSPYKAKNISDFWKRWHITLTRFFTTYLYIPLGGNRKGSVRTYLNVLLVFFASGLWHGANWTFILWGILHGVAIVFYRMFGKYLDKIPVAFSWFITFAYVNLAWVVFRADSITQAKQFIGHLLNGGPGPVSTDIVAAFPVFGLLFLLFGLLLALFAPNSHEIVVKRNINAVTLIFDTFLLVASVISLSEISTFLYYNF